MVHRTHVDLWDAFFLQRLNEAEVIGLPNMFGRKWKRDPSGLFVLHELRIPAAQSWLEADIELWSVEEDITAAREALSDGTQLYFGPFILSVARKLELATIRPIRTSITYRRVRLSNTHWALR